MFEVLAELSEDGPSLDDFPKIWAAFEQLEALLQRAAGRHAEAGEFALIGYMSMPSWLRHNCGMSHGAASAMVARGRFLNRYPAVGDAVEAGRISAGHVTLIRRMATGPVANIFDEKQQTVVNDVEPLTIVETEAYCRRWREKAEAEANMPEPKAPDKNLSTARCGDGSLLGSFTLDQAGAAQLEAALATAAQWDGPGDFRSVGHRAADALVEICAFFNANHDKDGTPRHRPHIELIQQLNDLPTDAFGDHGANCPTCGGCTCTRTEAWSNRTRSNGSGQSPTSRRRTSTGRTSGGRTSGGEVGDRCQSGDRDPLSAFAMAGAARSGTAGSGSCGFEDDTLFETGEKPDCAQVHAHCCGSSSAETSRSSRFRTAGVTIEGHPVPPRSMRAFLCDSVISRVTSAPGLKTEYGRETRTVPRALFRIVALRDGGCRFPGCCRKVAWTEAHHLEHWEDGGQTIETNLALVCSRHHHLIHAKGWTITMDAAGAITVTTPYGGVMTSKPRGPSKR